ncbi:MAG: hypothetical protein GXO47_11925 [Chlorobi bacterium]|nr:hypothetical protein [Chlorobiota bacterium]
MEYIEVDARGLSCPIPVMKTTKVIKKEQGPFKVLIDDETSFENVMRTLENFKLEIEKTEEFEDEDYKIIYVIR